MKISMVQFLNAIGIDYKLIGFHIFQAQHKEKSWEDAVSWFEFVVMQSLKI